MNHANTPKQKAVAGNSANLSIPKSQKTSRHPQPADKKIYNGFLDAGTKLIARDGPLALYKGFIPIWCRFAPTTVLQLVNFDNLLNFYGFNTI